MPGKGFKNPQSQEKAQHSKALRRTQLKRASQPPEFVLTPYEDMPTIPPNVQQGKMPDFSGQSTIQHAGIPLTPPKATPDFLDLPGLSPDVEEPIPPKKNLGPAFAAMAVNKQEIHNKFWQGQPPEFIPKLEDISDEEFERERKAVEARQPISSPHKAMPVAPLPPIGTPPPPPPEMLMTQQVPVVTSSGPLPQPSEIDPKEGIGTPLPYDTFNRAPDLIARGYTPEERAADLIARSSRQQSASSTNVGMILILGELLIFANVLVSGQMASMLGKLWQAPSSGTQAVATDASIKPILLEFIGLQAFLLVLVLLARLNRGMYSFSMTFILGVWAVWILFVLPDAIKSNSWNNTVNALFPNAGITPHPGPVPSQGTPSQQQNKSIQKNIGSGRIDPVSTKYESGYYTMNGRY